MNAMSTPQAPMVGGFYDRSPIDMPPVEARVILQLTSERLKKLGAEMGKLEVVALADALEEMAGGETESACQALREAETYRGMRA